MTTTNDNSKGSSNDALNNRDKYSSLLMEAMGDKTQMIKDLKELLNENVIEDIMFYHIIHDLKENKNDFLAMDGPLCKKIFLLALRICITYHRNIQFKRPTLKM